MILSVLSFSCLLYDKTKAQTDKQPSLMVGNVALSKIKFYSKHFLIWCKIKEIQVKLSMTQSSIVPQVELAFRE